MRILVVCSKTKGFISPFIEEQINSLSELKGIEFKVFSIVKRGLFGYLSCVPFLYKEVARFRPDIIHAHYGFSGLLANMQRKVPVITTFHGSDVYISRSLKWSKLSHYLSAASIFVEAGMMKKFHKHPNSYLIPCGVNLQLFSPMSKNKARELLNLETDVIYIVLYSGRTFKSSDYLLAKHACEMIEQQIGRKVRIVELKGFTRQEVNLYLNSAECVLYFCSSGASPQFIKEAMACCRPIVSTNVGDVNRLFESTNGCFITKQDNKDLQQNLKSALNFEREFKFNSGRDRIRKLNLDVYNVAEKIWEVYSSI